MLYYGDNLLVSFQETIRAFGHPNIAATHRSTLEVTKERYLTAEGDCIIGISADKAARDLREELKVILKDKDAQVILRITAGGFKEELRGSGDPRLTFKNSVSMVFRRSGFACGRTIMLHSNKAANDLDRGLVRALMSKDTPVELTIEAEL